MWQSFSDEWPNIFPSPRGEGVQAAAHLDWTPTLTRQDVARAVAYIPKNYSPGYRYPLICHFHRNGQNERDMEHWFPGVSENNYLALGIRAPFPHRRGLPGAYRWIGRRPDATQGVLDEALTMFCETHPFHPDRITLFGEGEGALAALQLFLCQRLQPDAANFELAGVICKDLPGGWPRALPPVRDGANGRILLLEDVATGEAHAALDGLVECGLDVQLISPDETDLPRRLDHWLMQSVSTAIW